MFRHLKNKSKCWDKHGDDEVIKDNSKHNRKYSYTNDNRRYSEIFGDIRRYSEINETKVKAERRKNSLNEALGDFHRTVTDYRNLPTYQSIQPHLAKHFQPDTSGTLSPQDPLYSIFNINSQKFLAKSSLADSIAYYDGYRPNDVYSDTDNEDDDDKARLHKISLWLKMNDCSENNSYTSYGCICDNHDNLMTVTANHSMVEQYSTQDNEVVSTSCDRLNNIDDISASLHTDNDTKSRDLHIGDNTLLSSSQTDDTISAGSYIGYISDGSYVLLDNDTSVFSNAHDKNVTRFSSPISNNTNHSLATINHYHCEPKNFLKKTLYCIDTTSNKIMNTEGEDKKSFLLNTEKRSQLSCKNDRDQSYAYLDQGNSIATEELRNKSKFIDINNSEICDSDLHYDKEICDSDLHYDKEICDSDLHYDKEICDSDLHYDKEICDSDLHYDKEICDSDLHYDKASKKPNEIRQNSQLVDDYGNDAVEYSKEIRIKRSQFYNDIDPNSDSESDPNIDPVTDQSSDSNIDPVTDQSVNPITYQSSEKRDYTNKVNKNFNNKQRKAKLNYHLYWNTTTNQLYCIPNCRKKFHENFVHDAPTRAEFIKDFDFNQLNLNNTEKPYRSISDSYLHGNEINSTPSVDASNYNRLAPAICHAPRSSLASLAEGRSEEEKHKQDVIQQLWPLSSINKSSNTSLVKKQMATGQIISSIQPMFNNQFMSYDQPMSNDQLMSTGQQLSDCEANSYSPKFSVDRPQPPVRKKRLLKKLPLHNDISEKSINSQDEKEETVLNSDSNSQKSLHALTNERPIVLLNKTNIKQNDSISRPKELNTNIRGSASNQYTNIRGSASNQYTNNRGATNNQYTNNGVAVNNQCTNNTGAAGNYSACANRKEDNYETCNSKVPGLKSNIRTREGLFIQFV